MQSLEKCLSLGPARRAGKNHGIGDTRNSSQYSILESLGVLHTTQFSQSRGKGVMDHLKEKSGREVSQPEQ